MPGKELHAGAATAVITPNLGVSVCGSMQDRRAELTRLIRSYGSAPVPQATDSDGSMAAGSDAAPAALTLARARAQRRRLGPAGRDDRRGHAGTHLDGYVRRVRSFAPAAIGADAYAGRVHHGQERVRTTRMTGNALFT